MPTGYTAAIADGIDFKTFALNCARAMGVCVTLRDEPEGGDQIPDRFEPSTTYADWAIRDADELRKVQNMSEAECSRAASEDFETAVRNRNDSLRSQADLLAKYESMLAQVNAWEPPTADHVRYKAFMVEQIESSIRFDCGYELSVPERLTGVQWRTSKIESLTRSIGRYNAEQAAEIARCNERTAWVKALRESL